MLVHPITAKVDVAEDEDTLFGCIIPYNTLPWHCTYCTVQWFYLVLPYCMNPTIGLPRFTLFFGNLPWLSFALLMFYLVSRAVGRLLEVGQLWAKSMHLAMKRLENLSALHADTPWKHDQASTYMESMVALIKHTHEKPSLATLDVITICFFPQLFCMRNSNQTLNYDFFPCWLLRHLWLAIACWLSTFGWSCKNA